MVTQFTLILIFAFVGGLAGSLIYNCFIGRKDNIKRMESDKQLRMIFGPNLSPKPNPFYKGDGGNGI